MKISHKGLRLLPPNRRPNPHVTKSCTRTAIRKIGRCPKGQSHEHHAKRCPARFRSAARRTVLPERCGSMRAFEASAPARVGRLDQAALRARCPHRLAHASARPDADRDRRHWRARSGMADRWKKSGPATSCWFEPGEKHWHGASPANAMTHIAIVEALRWQGGRLDGAGHRRTV